ncbi:MAG: thioredoxin [Dysgonamonadaceae bacterium]
MRTKLILAAMAASIILFTACNQNYKNNSTKQSRETEQIINSQKNDNKMAKTIHLTRAEFLTKVANFEKSPNEWEYLGDKPCIIDFYADWCGPCKMVAPILEELAAEYDGQIYIYKIDTEAEQQLSAEFGIRSIPTILFCPLGESPQMAQGALPKDALKQAINEVLLKQPQADMKES